MQYVYQYLHEWFILLVAKDPVGLQPIKHTTLWRSYTYTSWLYSKDFSPFSSKHLGWSEDIFIIGRHLQDDQLSSPHNHNENGSHFPDEFSPKRGHQMIHFPLPQFFKRVSTGDHQSHSDDHPKGYTLKIGRNPKTKFHRPTRWTLWKHGAPTYVSFCEHPTKTHEFSALRYLNLFINYNSICITISGKVHLEPLNISKGWNSSLLISLNGWTSLPENLQVFQQIIVLAVWKKSRCQVGQFFADQI